MRAALTALGHERTVALAAAGILLGASVFSVASPVRGGAANGTNGANAAARVAGGAAADPYAIGSVDESYDQSAVSRGTPVAALDRLGEGGSVPASATVQGPYLDDGTLLKPVAVDTAVADGSGLMRIYRVRAGDTLTGIAAKFHVSMMTVWWANDLKNKDDLHLGQQLRIPPVSGLVIQVQATDTLAGLAHRYRVSAQDIITTNGLEDQNLVVGQVLLLPGANGAHIAKARVVAAARPSTPRRPVSRPTRSGGGSSAPPPASYTGGRLLWPTVSHHISQYFHYGHYAIDIDGSTGDAIWAAAAGTVEFAGWKNNGGGFQVWIAHGSGLYTTYNHMSSVAVGAGQHVDRGQRVGRMGMTGNATGPHLHFEVWRGPIWNGGTRMNPLAYL